jgi:gentisate 1,2-dioxygenase
VATHHHLAEELIYIVSGSGYTLMWNRPGGEKVRYDWSEGDMLSPTLNAWHHHVNTSDDTPARYISLSSTPLTNNLVREPAFLNSSDYVFDDRWQQSIAQQPEYDPLGTEGMGVVRMRIGHQITDLPNREMRNRRENVLGITVRPEGDMAGNHTMEWEVREYQTPDSSSPGHRHPWETVYHIMSGEGYAILQREGEEKRRVNWKQGDLLIVEADEYHELLPLENSSPRIWQVKASGYFHNIGHFGIEQ